MIVIDKSLRQVVQGCCCLWLCPLNGGMNDLDRPFELGTAQHVEADAQVAPYEFEQRLLENQKLSHGLKVYKAHHRVLDDNDE